MRLGLGGVCRSVGERRVVVGLQKYGVGVRGYQYQGGEW